MSQSDLKRMMEYYDNLERQCNTPKAAIAELQSLGLLEEGGKTAARYRDPE